MGSTNKILWCSVLVLYCTVEILAFNDGSPGFLLTGPKHALRGTIEKFCLHLQGIHGASAVSLELLCDECTSWQNVSSVRKRLNAESNNGSCILLSLPIPPGNGTSTGKLSLKVYQEDRQGAEDSQAVIHSVKEIMIVGIKPHIKLIQTDKRLYTPDQKVHFRTLTLDHLLRPVASTLKKIGIAHIAYPGYGRKDVKNVTSALGFIAREWPLRSTKKMEIPRGRYIIDVNDGQETIEAFMHVKDEIEDLRATVTAPEHVLWSTGSFNVTVCARMTRTLRYPERSADVKVLNHPLLAGKSTEVVLPMVRETDCGRVMFNLTSWLPELKQWDQDLDLEVTGTTFFVDNDHFDLDTIIVRVVDDENKPQPVHLSLETPRTFKLGLPYMGRVVVRERPEGKLIPNEKVRLCFAEGFTNPDVTSPEWIIYPQEKTCRILVTDANGEVPFSLLPKDNTAVNLNLEVYASEYKGNWTLMVRALAKPSYSPSNTFAIIKPFSQQQLTCNSALKIIIYLTNVVEGQALRLNYIVTGRGDLLAQGTAEDHVRAAEVELPGILDELNFPVNVSVFEFELHVAPEFYPNATLTVFSTHQSELVTAQAELRITPCFPNPVTFRWDNETSLPGAKTGLTISATPGSLCGVSVVDESITLYEPNWQFKEETVLEKLTKFAIDSHAKPRQKTPDYLHCTKSNVETQEEVDPSQLNSKGQLAGRSFYVDVIQAFDMAGLLVMSNWTLESRPCHRAFLSSEQLQSESDDDPLGGPKAYVRERAWTVAKKLPNETPTYVPRTSLWAMHTIDSTGVAHLETTLARRGGPWIGRVLCVSNVSGFGMSPEVKISQPDAFNFVFDLTGDPVTYGESFNVTLRVENLWISTLPVQVRIERGSEFDLESDSTFRDLSIRANQTAVVHFTVRPMVFRSLTVRAKAEVAREYDSAQLPSYNIKAEAHFDVVQKTQN